MFRADTEIREAFRNDRYDVVQMETFNGRRGFLALHESAFINIPGVPLDQRPRKRAIYVEGSGYEMGYLMGLLCEPEIRRLVTQYPPAVARALVEYDLKGWSQIVPYKTLLYILDTWCEKLYYEHEEDIPKPLRDEMHGLVAGCRAYNRFTPVTFKNVLLVNAGIDTLMGFLYSGLDIDDWLEGALKSLGCFWRTMAGLPLVRSLAKKFVRYSTRADRFRAPLACNAFAAWGNATRLEEGRHHFYFGRDFQFPAEGGFQDSCCYIVYNPTYALDDGLPALPHVSLAAPGMVGSTTAMNCNGVALGVNVAIGGNCRFRRPGLNSLLMVRYIAYCGYDLARAIDAMVRAQRGVTWIYPLADGTNDQAVVVEAGKRTEDPEFYKRYAPDYLTPRLAEITPSAMTPCRKGLYARDSQWVPSAEWLALNPFLFQQMGYAVNPPERLTDPRGHLNDDWKTGLSDNRFFMPQRESHPDLIVATNVFHVPEMRICSMDELANQIARSRTPDFIWRYDELNRRCSLAYGEIDWAKARELIDFLSPAQTPQYYTDHSGRPIEIIGGGVSLLDLTDRTITSHFGYRSDDWVDLDLKNYI